MAVEHYRGSLTHKVFGNPLFGCNDTSGNHCHADEIKGKPNDGKPLLLTEKLIESFAGYLEGSAFNG